MSGDRIKSLSKSIHYNCRDGMVISPIKEKDLDEILFIRNHISTRSMLHDDKKFSKDDINEWFLKVRPIWFSIFINSKLIGYIRTSNINFEKKTLYVGCDISPNHRRKGYALKAYSILIEALKMDEWNKAFLRVLKKNKIAIYLYRKIGFIITEETSEDFLMEYDLREKC